MSGEKLQLPAGWPDGPLDEVLGELLKAAFVACREPGSFVSDDHSPACTWLDGSFDLRRIGVAIGPQFDELRKVPELRRAIAAMKALHFQYLPAAVNFDCCAHCNQISGGYVPWPCATYRALTGDQGGEQ